MTQPWTGLVMMVSMVRQAYSVLETKMLIPEAIPFSIGRGTPGESATDDANQMSRPNYMDETSPSLTVATSTSEGKMAALGTHAEQHGRKNSVSFILTSRCPYLNCKVNR